MYSLGNFAVSWVEIFEVHATDRYFFGWFSRGGNEAHRNRSIHAVGHEQVTHWVVANPVGGLVLVILADSRRIGVQGFVDVRVGGKNGFGHLEILEAKIGLRG
jgi:hypothetical protein